MSDQTSDAARPRLAGALALPGEKAPSNEFTRIPAVAYQEMFRPRNSLIGRFLMVNDPAAIKHVLIDNVANYPKRALEQRFFTIAFGDGLLGSDGEIWRTHRQIMAPAFSPRSVASYAPATTDTAQAYLTRWDARMPGAAFDMADEMSALTLQITCRTMFSTGSEEIMTLVNESLARTQASLNIGPLDLVPMLASARDRRRLATVSRIVADLDAAVASLIAERVAAGEAGPSDLLARLIAVKDQQTGQKLTAREVRDEVVTIFIAGHETTAMALTWAWYLLALHPREEAKLHAELAQVLDGRAPVHADLAQLAYTRCVVEEAMRLYPPVPALSGRQAIAADEICGHKVAARTTVVISPWVLHRHRKLWDDPERFEPERFSAERSVGRSRFSFLPFGGGPRVCIGASLAVNEAMLILAALAQHYRPRLVPGQIIDVRQRVTLRPRYGMKMTLEPRADA